eukprot:snap_masked-scaffold_7-processed-gene-11.4-mRNA-1 protein AED:0.18 eAED:0.30 QI:0/-1/0/1/-1/1/1/0/379
MQQNNSSASSSHSPTVPNSNFSKLHLSTVSSNTNLTKSYLCNREEIHANTNKVDLSGEEISYNATRVIGNGSFGVVFEAEIVETGQKVAIKKILVDTRFKNREVEIMKKIQAIDGHAHILPLLNSFYSTNELNEEFLHLVLEYFPNNLSQLLSEKTGDFSFTLENIKILAYQAFSALKFLHEHSIVHRDVKPSNFLVNTNVSLFENTSTTHNFDLTNNLLLKLADFGSAKFLQQDELNISYICSRFYRAPELLFGSTKYDTKIDVWGFGCILAQMYMKHEYKVSKAFFAGRNQVGQIIEIIKILGSPTKTDVEDMNSEQAEIDLPHIEGTGIKRILRGKGTTATEQNEEFINLVQRLIVFSPKKRLSASAAIEHSFFGT